MAGLQKLTVVRYVDRAGNRVTKGTPGARKIKEKTDQWYAVFREGNNKVRIPLSTDKTAAQTMLADLLRERAYGKAGLVSPYKKHLDRPIGEHLAEYLAAMKQSGVSTKHYSEKDRQLNAILKAIKANTLADLTADAVDRFLAGLTCSARTKGTYRAAVMTFGNWLKDKDRLERNPFEKVTKPNGDAVRVRRALLPEQLQLLLNTTRERPFKEMATIRRGPRKGQLTANVRAEVRDQMILLGRERALIYKTAIFTGLRRGEIAALRIDHLHLDHKPAPYLELPGIHTKNGDAVKQPIVPSFAAEVRQWIADTRRRPGDRLFTVPNEIVKDLKRDLKAAGIPFEDELGRTFDFHALRHCADTLLGMYKVWPAPQNLVQSL